MLGKAGYREALGAGHAQQAVFKGIECECREGEGIRLGRMRVHLLGRYHGRKGTEAARTADQQMRLVPFDQCVQRRQAIIDVLCDAANFLSVCRLRYSTTFKRTPSSVPYIWAFFCVPTSETDA